MTVNPIQAESMGCSSSWYSMRASFTEELTWALFVSVHLTRYG